MEASAQLPGWSGLNSPQFYNLDKGAAMKIAQIYNSEKVRNRIAPQFCIETTGREHSSAILKKWKLKMSKLDRTFPKYVFTHQQIRQEV